MDVTRAHHRHRRHRSPFPQHHSHLNQPHPRIMPFFKTSHPPTREIKLTGTSRSGRRTVERAELLCEWKCCRCGVPKSQFRGIEAGNQCLKCKHTRCVDYCEIKHFGLWVKARTVMKLAGITPQLPAPPPGKHKDGKSKKRESKARGKSTESTASELTRLAHPYAADDMGPGMVVYTVSGQKRPLMLQVNITNNYGDDQGGGSNGDGIGSGAASTFSATGSGTGSTRAPSTLGGHDAYYQQGPQAGNPIPGVQGAGFPYSLASGQSGSVALARSTTSSQAGSSYSRTSAASKATNASRAPSGVPEPGNTSSRRSDASRMPSQVSQGRSAAPSGVSEPRSTSSRSIAHGAANQVSQGRSAAPNGVSEPRSTSSRSTAHGAASQVSQGRSAAPSQFSESGNVSSRRSTASRTASQLTLGRSMIAPREAESSYSRNPAASLAASQITQSRVMPPPSQAGSARSDARSRISGRQWSGLGTIVPDDSISCAGAPVSRPSSRTTVPEDSISCSGAATSQLSSAVPSTRPGSSWLSGGSQSSSARSRTAVPSDDSWGSVPTDVRFLVGPTTPSSSSAFTGSSRTSGSTIRNSASVSQASGSTIRSSTSASHTGHPEVFPYLNR